MKQYKSMIGAIHAIIAFTLWGIFPLYWKMLREVSAFEILAHRIFWSCVFLFIFLKLRKQFVLALIALKNKETRWLICASTILIAINWLLYVWAVNAGHVLETSLGYYINPLINVLLGVIILGERLSKLKKIAVLIAGVAVFNLTINYGRLPWIALSLAFSFAFYGFARKKIPVFSPATLWCETALLVIPALLLAGFFYFSDQGHFLQSSLKTNLLLIGAGIVTPLPLLFFGSAAQKLQLSTLGLIQYLAPTLQFLLAVFVFKEEFTQTHFITFALIWLALFIYSLETYKRSGNR